MEVVMTARASGPFGELNRKQRLNSSNYPKDYLLHLSEIGVAVITQKDAPPPPPEFTAQKKSVEEKKPSLSSPAAQVSQSKMFKKLRDKTSSPSTQTTK